LGERRDRTAREIHVGQRLDQDQLGGVDPDAEAALTDVGDRAAVPTELRPGTVGEQASDEEPDVVSVALVLPAGVAEPDDHPHGSAPRGLKGSTSSTNEGAPRPVACGTPST